MNFSESLTPWFTSIKGQECKTTEHPPSCNNKHQLGNYSVVMYTRTGIESTSATPVLHDCRRFKCDYPRSCHVCMYLYSRGNYQPVFFYNHQEKWTLIYFRTVLCMNKTLYTCVWKARIKKGLDISNVNCVTKMRGLKCRHFVFLSPL